MKSVPFATKDQLLFLPPNQLPTYSTGHLGFIDMRIDIKTQVLADVGGEERHWVAGE